jgi:AcrR family transcriptional regulator
MLRWIQGISVARGWRDLLLWWVTMATRGVKTSRQKALTELRREEILRAAIRIFGKKGFAATCVEDIADAAKIAKGTLYLYFKSKEEIYTAAVQLAVQELQTLSAERVGAATGVREKLAVAIGLRMSFWHEQQAIYRLLLTVGREPQHRRQTNELMRRAQASFVEILEGGVAAGELEPGNFGDVAWLVLDMIRGANERRMDRMNTCTPEQDAATILGFALRQVGL